MKHVTRLLQPLLLLVLLTSTLNTIAQSTSIGGTVLDEGGNPLEQVSIIAKKGNSMVASTSTNENGVFTFKDLTSKGPIDLYFTYVGYLPHIEKNITTKTGQSPLLIRLVVSEERLDQVVVVGYGTQSKRKVTGAISQIKSDELSKYASGGFAQQLAGKASGVSINANNGQPGVDPQVVIRGVSTLTAGAKPLIVVDGFPLTEGTSLGSINPMDIATLDILKDPASASIYGSRAANGVILITTKKNTQDKVAVTFDMYTGVQKRADNMKLIDAYEAAIYFTEARDQAYVSKDPENRSINDSRADRIAKGASKRDLRLNYIDPYLNKEPGLTNTNWLDEILVTAPISNYNIAVAGRAGEHSAFFISGNYFDQKGIVLGSDMKRYSSTIKLNSSVSDKVKMGINLMPTFTNRNYHNELGTATGNFPFFKPYNDDGSLSVSTQINANTPEDGSLNENAVALTKMITKQLKTFRIFGSSFVEAEIVDGLKFKTLLGADFGTAFDNYYNPSNVGAYRTAAPKPASASETQSQMWNYLTENTLTYNKQFGNHQLNLLGGYSYQREVSQQVLINGSGIPDDNLNNIAGASNFSVIPNRYTWTQVSAWTRAQYDFQGKYMFGATFRRDGSSRFGADSKWGNFPSITAGWIISREDFFKSTAIDFLKIRTSWGVAGNNQVGSYGSFALLSVNNYVNGNTLAPGYYASSAPNPLLSWETQKAWNFGLDVTAFKNFTLGINYYHSNTSDLLLNVPVPEQSGFSSSLQNLGEIQNTGIEVDFGNNSIQLGAVNWSFNANFSTNKNKVLSLADGQSQIISGNMRTKVGGPIAELYGYKIIGIYKSQAEIDKTPVIAGTRIGDNIVEDTNGDGVITPDDRIGLGTYAPKINYGFQSAFAYKGFDFSFSVSGIVGRTIYDGSLAGHENGEAFALATKYYFDNRYHPVNNPNGTLPQPTTTFSQNRLQTGWASSRHFYNADFLRIQHIRIGYSFPVSMLTKSKITNLNVYVSTNNPFTFTPYRGFNPEGTSDNILQAGTAGHNYPIAKSILAGISLTF